MAQYIRTGLEVIGLVYVVLILVAVPFFAREIRRAPDDSDSLAREATEGSKRWVF